jgi:hypothetical protein
MSTRKPTTRSTRVATSAVTKGGIVVTGGAAALLTLGAWDKSAEILEKIGAVGAQQNVLAVQLGSLEKTITAEFSRNDERINGIVGEMKGIDSRVRLLETTIATMGGANK